MKRNKKLLPLILLIISAFFLSYTFYESEIKYKGTEHSYYFKYYLICFLFVLCSVISFFLKRETIRNISIIFISTLFILYLINTYVFFKIGRTVNSITGRFQFYEDQKTLDNNIVIAMYRESAVYDHSSPFELSDRSNKKTIMCNENGYFSIFHTDRYGFNNPDSEWEKKEIDFLLIGDSFVHGACVNESDTISGNLRKMTDNGGVLNLGYSGNGSLKEYATLREYLPLKKTNRVVWFYFEHSDLIDLIDELENKILSNYLHDRTFTQKLHIRQNEIDKKLEKIFDESYQQKRKMLRRKYRNHILSFIRLYDLRRFVKQTLMSTLSHEPLITVSSNQALRTFSEIIYLSKILSEDNGAKFYFVFLPRGYRYNRHKTEPYEKLELKEYKNVINIVNKLNIPIIDINKDLFKKHSDPLSLFPNRLLHYHYNELGYQLVAKTILKKIIEYEKNLPKNTKLQLLVP